MECPHCKTENRDDRAECYHCGRDLSLLRLIHNRAKQHFNTAVEHVENGNYYEAIGELNSAIELNSRMIESYVLRGTILARLERLDEARQSLDSALALHPNALRAHKYLLQLPPVEGALPLTERVRKLTIGAVGVAIAGLMLGGLSLVYTFGSSGGVEDGFMPASGEVAEGSGNEGQEERSVASEAYAALRDGRYTRAMDLSASIQEPDAREEFRRTALSSLDRDLDAIKNGIGRPYSGAEASGWFVAAQRIKELRSKNPQGASRDRIDKVAGDLAGELFSLTRLYATEVTEKDSYVPFDDFSSTILDLDQSFEGQVTELRERRNAEVQEQFVARLARLELQLREGAAKDDLIESQVELFLFARAFSIDDERLDAINARLQERLEQKQLREMEELASSGELTKFAHVYTELTNNSGTNQDTIGAAEAMIPAAIETQERIISDLLDSAERNKALAQAELTEKTFGEGALSQGIVERLEAAREQVAIDAYYQVIATTNKLEDSLELDRSTAERTLIQVSQARGPLPPRLSRRADEVLAFAAASAHRALGEEKEAAREIEELTSRNPESSWLLLWENTGARTRSSNPES